MDPRPVVGPGQVVVYFFESMDFNVVPSDHTGIVHFFPFFDDKQRQKSKYSKTKCLVRPGCCTADSYAAG